MTEFLSEKAISLWGPFAFCVILLGFIVFVLGKQYLLRQKTYEERDERRTASFVDTTKQFMLSMTQNTNTIDKLNENVQENTSVLRDVHTTVTKMNERL